MTTLSDDEVRDIALWQAIEDYAGLWELFWELNTVDPEGDEAAHFTSATQAVRSLVEDGLIELFYCQEPYGEMTRVPSGERQRVIEEQGYWQEPAKDARSVRMSATEAGEAFYQGAAH